MPCSELEDSGVEEPAPGCGKSRRSYQQLTDGVRDGLYRCRVDMIKDRQWYIMFRKKEGQMLVKNERVKIYSVSQQTKGDTKRDWGR